MKAGIIRCISLATVVAGLSFDSAAGTDLSAAAYVQRGLMAHWDGIDNAGTGDHDAGSLVWKDLSGNGHDLTLNAAGASFVGGMALHCFGPVQSATLPYALTDYLTIEACYSVSSDSSQKGCVLNAGTQNRFIWSIKASNAMQFSQQLSGMNIPDQSATNTYAGVYSSSASTSTDATYLNGGSSLGSYSETWSAWPTVFTVGYYNGNASRVYVGDLFGIRLYDRTLSAAEVAYNSAVDDVRYRGMDAEEAFSRLTEWPDGYRWNPERKCIEMRVRVTGLDGVSSVTINGIAATEAWVKQGAPTEVCIVAEVGKVPVRPAVLPGGSVWTQDGRLSFPCYGADIVAEASAIPVVSEELVDVSASSVSIAYDVRCSGCEADRVDVYLAYGADAGHLSETNALATGVMGRGTATTSVLPGSSLVYKVFARGGSRIGETELANVTTPPVVYVSADATDAGTGASWTDTMTFAKALAKAAAATEGMTEIWIAGDIVLTETPKLVLSRPMTIRGGFKKGDRTTDDRMIGSRSTIDGNDVCDCLQFDHTQKVTLDSLAFVRGYARGVRNVTKDNATKGSSGDLSVMNCAFCANSSNGGVWGAYDSSMGGGGACFYGAGSARLSIVDCEFAGNCPLTGKDAGCGGGANVSSYASVEVVGCSFVSNSVVRTSTGLGDGTAGLALNLKDNAEIKVENCAFRGNSRTPRETKNGVSVLEVSGACNGEISNCSFTGNENAQGGVVIFRLGSSSNTVRFNNNTVAYNFCQTGGRGVLVKSGTITAENNIVYGNLYGDATAGGADVYVNEGAAADFAYSMFTDDTTNSVCAAEGGTLTVSNCLYDDPLFVTVTADFMSTAKASDFPKTAYTRPSFDVMASYNVHLRGGSGYRDETTGEIVEDYTGRKEESSPALDAGDPLMKCVEPKPNGRRVNMGAYGNTPWATMSNKFGLVLIVR